MSDSRCSCLLLKRAARLVTQLYDEHLRPVGLRVGQFSLLATLRHADGLAMGELAERMSMDRTTLTRSLKPMVDAGWIEAVPDPGDRRRTRLGLTPAGRAALRAAVPRWRDAQHALRERVGAGRIHALHACIDDALEHLE